MKPFWQAKPLAELSVSEWESLCDGCARCCLHKLEDEETGEVFYTSIVCQYLDDQCRCRCYNDRHQKVPMCIWLTPEAAANSHWLPLSCAYRRLALGLELEPWHPLRSGNPGSVHRAGISVRGKCVSDAHVHPDGYADYIIHWVELQAK